MFLWFYGSYIIGNESIPCKQISFVNMHLDQNDSSVKVGLLNVDNLLHINSSGKVKPSIQMAQ